MGKITDRWTADIRFPSQYGSSATVEVRGSSISQALNNVNALIKIEYEITNLTLHES